MAYRDPGWKTFAHLAFMLALLLTPAIAFADDTDDLEGLLDEEVVTGASKTEELAKDAPGTTSVITAEDIRRYGIRSISEAINFLGMGLVTENPLHSVEVGGRGVLLTADFGNHILLVVDGHVLNEPWSGTAYFDQGAGIPMELIDHIELVLGPGSVLYGGNAMIGVINITTKRASGYAGAHVIAEGSLSPEQGRDGKLTSFAPGDLGGSYRVAAGIGHQLTLLDRPVSFTAQLELYRQNGPSFEWGPQKKVLNDDDSPANFGPSVPLGVWGGRVLHQYTTSIPSLYVRAESGNLSFMFRAETAHRRTPAQGFAQQDTDFDEPRSFQRDRFISAGAQYRKQLGPSWELSVRGYADAYDYLQHQYTSDPAFCSHYTVGACIFEAKGQSRWMGTDVSAQHDWLGNGRLTTLVGADGRLRFAGGETDSVEASTDVIKNTEGRKSIFDGVWALYAQQRWTPVSAIHLNGGARFDTDPRGGSRISPRGAAAFDVWRDGVFKISYAEAFRAPSFDQMYYVSNDRRPNPELQSEVVRGAETSIEQRFGRQKILFGGYRTWWSNMVGSRSIDDLHTQYENISRIDNWGYNGRLEGAIGNFRYGASVTGAHTRRTTPDGTSSLPVAPQLFGNARVSYVFPASWPTVALATTFVGPRPADRAYDGNFTPLPVAPASAELRLTLSQQVPHMRGLSYRITGSFATGSVSPYVAGPTQALDPTDPATAAELTPVVRLTGFATLKYDLPL